MESRRVMQQAYAPAPRSYMQ